jgi:hypothetical protein
MAVDKRAAILRILDDQNRLVERADTKAIALLTTLGVFTAFFVSQFRSIPTTPFAIVLICLYFVAVLLSMVCIVMAINPRIRSTPQKGQHQSADEKTAFQPTFYAGICAFPNASAYRNSLEGMLNEETSTTDTYIEQIYAVAKINDAKYRYVKRAVVLVVITLVAQLTLIAYTYATVMRLPQ